MCDPIQPASCFTTAFKFLTSFYCIIRDNPIFNLTCSIMLGGAKGLEVSMDEAE
jgi:hypothetical protein